MGREASITLDQVAAAAEALRADGVKPTLRGVRERLGSGSLGTIQKLLRQWQQEQGKTGEVCLALPPTVERALLDFLAQELTAGKADLRAALVETQQALAELATEAEGQAQEIGDLTAALEAERQSAAGLRGELVRLQEERDQARRETRQEREIAEGLRIELAKASLQLESLPTLQAELSSERAARIAAEKQVAVLEERMQWAPPPSRG